MEATAATSGQDDAASFDRGLSHNYFDHYLIILLRMVCHLEKTVFEKQF
jgi:hypothetical protein